MKNSSRYFLPLLLGLGFFSMANAAGTAESLSYLREGKPDAVSLLAPPPLPDSPEQAADLAEVRAVCHAAPSNEVAIAFSEKKFSAFTFAPAIGAFFQSNSLPKTAAFFERVQKDAAAVTDQAKEFYKRPRPFVIDPSLASGQLEKSFSYPSGHSTESMVLALVLADLFPNLHDAILAEARAIGWHRVEIARHYPIDIYAGQVLAQAIVRQMKKSEEFQKDFAEARTEVAAAQAAAKN
ncbi:MAG: phosphatase PAP2 family protein [Verrucomicrobiia bacterium]